MTSNDLTPSPTPEPAQVDTRRNPLVHWMTALGALVIIAAVIAVLTLPDTARKPIADSTDKPSGVGEVPAQTKTGEEVPTAEPEPLSPQTIRGIDVATAQTLVAAARLDSFPKARKSNRAASLKRTQENLDTAMAALGAASIPGQEAEVATANKQLAQLHKVVDTLRSCIEKDKRAKKSAKARKSARAQCRVDADEISTARAAGAAVGAITPYGSLTSERLASIAKEVAVRAKREATSADAPPVGDPLAR